MFQNAISAVAFVFIIIYALVGLSLGAVFQVLNKYYFPSLPYTVVVFFLGLFLSVGVSFYHHRAVQNANYSNTIAGDVYFLPQNSRIGWELIVYFFLPILIYGETMNLNWHHAISALAQSTWLAGPGAVIGCVLMGLFAKLFLSWMDWNVAFMFGAILSATDPVAVVSLLKTSGASHSLTLLIVGESLLNDGSAMVLFSLFFGLFTKTTNANFSSILIFFLKDALCSVLFGIFVGLLTNRLMRIFDNPVKGADMNVQIIITLLGCYVSFNVAQASFEISGVLSASAAGLVLAWLAPPFILHHDRMHSVWSSLEWICNTLIFFFAGLQSGGLIYNYGNFIDLYYITILYLILLIIRVIVLAIFYPIISKGNLVCTLNDTLFMIWAGLRGALGIALALEVQDHLKSSHYCSDPENSGSGLCQGKFFIYIVGIVAYTLVFNATTANALLRKLRLVIDKEESLQKRMILDRIRRNIRKKMKASCEEDLGKDFGGINPKQIVKLCRLLAETTVNLTELDENASIAGYAMSGGLQGENDVRLSALHELVTRDRLSVYRTDRSDSNAGIQTDLMDYARTRFIGHLRFIYHDAIMSGKIGRASYASQALLNSLDVAQDFTATKEFGFKDWDTLIKVLELNSSIINVASSFDTVFNYIGCYPDKKFYAYIVARRDRRLIYGLTNYIAAHESAQKLIPSIFGGDKNDPSTIDGIPEVEQLLWESQTNVTEAKKRLNEFSQKTIERFYLQRAARIILQKQVQLINEMVGDGTLSEKDAALFFGIIDKDYENVNKERELLTKDFVKERTETLKRQEIELRQSDGDKPPRLSTLQNRMSVTTNNVDGSFYVCSRDHEGGLAELNSQKLTESVPDNNKKV